jgi:hypothetical protein
MTRGLPAPGLAATNTALANRSAVRLFTDQSARTDTTKSKPGYVALGPGRRPRGRTRPLVVAVL